MSDGMPFRFKVTSDSTILLNYSDVRAQMLAIVEGPRLDQESIERWTLRREVAQQLLNAFDVTIEEGLNRVGCPLMVLEQVKAESEDTIEENRHHKTLQIVKDQKGQ